MLLRIFSVLFISLGFWGFWSNTDASILEPPLLPPYMINESPWADSLLQTLSLDEKIGQLFMVAANSRDSNEDYYLMIDSFIENYGLGGLIYFQTSPTEHTKLVNRFQSKSTTPMMNGIDGEWGLAMRIDSLQPFPWNMTLGAIQDNDLLYEMGAAMAQECKTLGIHFNFAPVVDVNSNPLNPIINARSYGENPQNVSAKGFALMQGMQQSGVLACAKHFPGHGDTESDSHKTLPIIKHTKARIDTVDVLPFKQLIDGGVASVMVAHLNISSLDSTFNRPSTLSPYIVDTMLRQQLNFNGLIFTDALNMKGVSSYFESGELEVAALLAGNDVLLFPEDIPAAFTVIKRAISDSILTEARIDESCAKILKAKEWLGLTKLVQLDTLHVLERATIKNRNLLTSRLEKAALTLVKNQNDNLPIRSPKNNKIAVLTLGDSDSNAFVNQLKRYAEVKVFDTSIDEPSDFNQLIISLHKSTASPWKSYEISSSEKELIEMYSKQTKVSLVVFANPYSLLNANYLARVNSILIAYQNTQGMQSLAAQSVFGAISVNGKLPVSLSADFTAGIGIETSSTNKLRYTEATSQGFNKDTLALIDSIAQYAIEIKATPGCQVLVAKGGAVVYSKCFGFHTYDSLVPVNEFDVYDIASITKIASTLPILMQKVDAGTYDIDEALISYLAINDTCSKAELTTREILAHQGQLWPWIPFYRETLNEKGGPNPSIYSSNKEGAFQIKVAQDVYMNESYLDTILDRVIHSKMREEKGYKYSDLAYYILKEIIEEQEGNSLKELIQDRVFKELGANYTTYHPLEKFKSNTIVPTENDTYFRNQLLCGYVHDPGAAMQNGVGGHAGLFSNANDLAKLMQMYLNGGTYGGTRYINEETVSEFTSCQYCRKDNRRGIGFDKPVLDDSSGPTCKQASSNSFGHSGFTGTITWADPEQDLIYVFLSNRIHPSAENSLLVKENIRTRIQEVIYKALE